MMFTANHGFSYVKTYKTIPVIRCTAISSPALMSGRGLIGSYDLSA